MNRIIAIAVLVLALCCLTEPGSGTAWEGGLKTGFDTNVDHAVNDAKTDTYLSGYVSIGREPTGETRWDWIFSAALEGAVYNEYRDLSYGQLTIAPGFIYIPHRLVLLSLSPFLQAKGVTDSDQSSLAGGGRLLLREQLNSTVYLGQYYLLKSSTAQEDVYSFTENAVGILAGAKLRRNITGEIAYEYSRGDAFRALASGIPVSGHGKHRHFSRTFKETLIREPVDRHSVSIEVNVDWSPTLFSTVGYTYATMQGDAGTSNSHAGSFGVGFRF